MKKSLIHRQLSKCVPKLRYSLGRSNSHYKISGEEEKLGIRKDKKKKLFICSKSVFKIQTPEISPYRCSSKKAVLKIFVKFTKNH